MIESSCVVRKSFLEVTFKLQFNTKVMDKEKHLGRANRKNQMISKCTIVTKGKRGRRERRRADYPLGWGEQYGI